jgi:hypothetical protein
MASIVETAERFPSLRVRSGLGGMSAVLPSTRDFSAQAAALEGVDSLEAYTEWMKGLFTPLPDRRAEVRSFAVDEKRNKVSVYGVFHGTHTGECGPVPPTGKSAAADCVCDIASRLTRSAT